MGHKCNARMKRIIVCHKQVLWDRYYGVVYLNQIRVSLLLIKGCLLSAIILLNNNDLVCHK